MKHLWFFSLKDNRADQVYRVASGEKTWYFYASAGINISGKVIQFIEEGDCDNFFYDNNQDMNLYNFTQNLYNEFFVGFNNFWVEKGYDSFMLVNSTLEKFMETRAKIIFQRLIQAKKTF